ncbi:MAG: Fe-S cluster assembly protein SufD [Acidobacteria bacterium]|nr:Fe-S cluster assembly protein SufD [Acidobacteriota bacterium]
MDGTFGADAVRELAARSGEPDWFVARRLRSLERFGSLPWPDPSLEEWRHTDLSGFSLDGLTPLPPRRARASNLDGVPREALARMGEVGEREGLAVQVDADVVHLSLGREARAAGAVFAPLPEAARDHPDLVQGILGSAGTPASEEKLTTLADAFASGGTFLHVPRGRRLRAPVQSFRWLSGPGIAVFPRVVIVAEEGASVTYIEEYRAGELGGPALACPVVEIYAGPGADVSFLTVQDWPGTVWHFQTQRAIVGRDASLRSLGATFGGRASRAVVESVMDGAGGSSEMLGVYFADSDQRFSYWSLQDHRAPNTRSTLTLKGALKGRSRAVYRGLVHIQKGADQADAYQVNRNLLLSGEAKADPAPFLEIEANQVRCSHATSVGQPPADQLFYLQSRGIPPKEAERLVVKGFFQEVLDRTGVPEVRGALERAVESELERDGGKVG